MRRLPEDLAQLRPDRLEGFRMLNKLLAPRPAAPTVEPQPAPMEPRANLVVGRLCIQGDTISVDSAPPAMDRLDNPNHFKVEFVHAHHHPGRL